MAAVIKIQIESSGGAGDVAKDVDKIGDAAQGAGKKFSAMGEIVTGALRHIGTLAIDAVVGGFQAIGGAISDGIADAKNYAIIAGQTEAVIKSTGGAAGVSAEHVADYASSLSDAAGTSLFGDDQIQESTNLLLTFSEIKGATLDAATAISVDMAQALGGAPKDAAIQLGKALNDPVKGITALTRVGVVFSEEQKAQIQAMQEAGDTAGAQAVILAELNKEFGGSAAAAAAATGGWSEFNGRMGEAKEALGTAILPLLSQLAGVLLTTVLPVIEDLAARFGPFVESLGPIVAQVQSFVGGLLASFQDTSAIDGFSAATGALASFWSTQLQPALQAVWTVLQTQVMPILNDLATALFPIVGAAIQILAGFWTDVLVPAVQMLWSILSTVVLPIIAALAGWLADNLPGAIQATADFFTNTLFPILHQVYDFISINVIPILAMVAEWLITNVPVAIQAASDFFNTVLLPAIMAVWAFINDSVLPIFAMLWTWLSTTIPAALQTLADFWNTVLLPAINAVWAFITNFVIPLFTALVQLHIAVLGTAIRLLGEVWSNVLLPALTKVWEFIKTSLGPVIDWLNVLVLKPLMQILSDIYFTVLGTVLPILTKLSSLVKDEVTKAFNNLNSMAGAAAGGLSKIGDAVSGVIGWIGDLIEKLNSVSIPDWLEGKSPPPMANWFSDIAKATAAVNAQLPELAMNISASLPNGGGGNSYSTSNARSFTYAPQYSGGGAMDGPMDLALASSLASV